MGWRALRGSSRFVEAIAGLLIVVGVDSNGYIVASGELAVFGDLSTADGATVGFETTAW